MSSAGGLRGTGSPGVLGPAAVWLRGSDAVLEPGPTDPLPLSIPEGLTREAVLKALADLDAGVAHPFGAPTGHELVYDGRRYPPKAVVGLACRHALGRLLRPEQFSGGEAPGQANYVLHELGFAVEKKGDAPSPADRRAWSRAEVDLIAANYFLMLAAELDDRPYNKAEHNRSLRELLDGRSRPSVEFRHRNISAVLVDLGLPYIEGTSRPATTRISSGPPSRTT